MLTRFAIRPQPDRKQLGYFRINAQILGGMTPSVPEGRDGDRGPLSSPAAA